MILSSIELFHSFKNSPFTFSLTNFAIAIYAPLLLLDTGLPFSLAFLILSGKVST